MLNGLPWKWTKIILSFLRLYPSPVFQTVGYEGYSVSSKGFLPAVVDVMVFWIKFTHSHPFLFADSYDVSVYSYVNSPLLFPSSIMDTFRPGGLVFECVVFFTFYVIHGFLTASIVGWCAIPSFNGSRFIRTLCYDPSILGGPAEQGLSDPWRGYISWPSWIYFRNTRLV